MATTGIQLIDTFLYSGKRFLDLRQGCATLEELLATAETSIPDGFTKFCEETQCWYEWNSHNDPDPETGKWRKSVPVNEMWSEEYIFAITDRQDTLLFGIREDGEVVYNRGMSDETRARLGELDGIRTMHSENMVFAIMDASDRMLFGIDSQGRVTYDRGIPGEVKPILARLNRHMAEARAKLDITAALLDEARERLAELDSYRLMEDENFLFAITDNGDRLLFGIGRDGRVVYDRGIPGEVQTRFDELSGYQIMHDDKYILAITDSIGNVLLGIESDGEVTIPKGVVRVLTWEEYEAIAHPHPGTLYAIEGKRGMIEGAYVNGRALGTGEEQAFIREGNGLLYRGKMNPLPRIWIDHESMELKADYPSDYSGPRFGAEDGMLYIY